MTVPDELVKAVKAALVDAGYIVDIHAPAPFLNLCVAAVLRALPESEAVRVATTGMLSRNTLHALARLADDA